MFIHVVYAWKLCTWLLCLNNAWHSCLNNINLWNNRFCTNLEWTHEAYKFVMLSCKQIKHMCWRVNLQPLIITIFQEVRSKGQGQRFITQLNKNYPLLTYFITTTHILSKESYKEQRRKVRVWCLKTNLHFIIG